MTYRIRKKGDKYMVEKSEKGKWVGRKLDPKKIWNLLMSDSERKNVSKTTREMQALEDESFALYPLNEPTEDDIMASLEETDRFK